MKSPQLCNLDLENIVTPVDELERLLKLSHYDEEETKFLVEGFSKGFDIGYEGPFECQDTSRNIPFKKDVGDESELWSKLMKEVEASRYTGPFEKIPFENFMQSPIGLVPKSGNKTRQIFHLSYNFKNGNKSLNYHTPKDKCSVKYNDIDSAVQRKIWL